MILCYSSLDRLGEFLSWSGRHHSLLVLFCISGCSTSVSLDDSPSPLGSVNVDLALAQVPRFDTVCNLLK